MRPPRSISVLMPTWQGAPFLDRVLSALRSQDVSLPWDFRAIDSGSTDGTLEILARHAADFPVPFALEHIDPVEFDHGDTRNRLAAHSSGELLVFLTQDAIPCGPSWLGTLLARFDDPRVAAAYCRNVARPDADRLTRLFSSQDPGYRPRSEIVERPDDATWAGLDEHARRVWWNFNDVASAIRREVWERHPFPRTWFGEDVLMARALLEAGYRVAYEAEAPVQHSHDYDAQETRARARIDGRFNAEWLGRVCVASEEDADELARRTALADRQALAAEGLAGAELEREARRAAELRRAAFRGLFEGGRSAVRRPPTRVLARPDLSILYVLHGFPPDTWAGTEVYTLHLARAMQARGHRVAVFARAPAEKDEPDFTLRRTELDGLPVLRMTQRLQHPSLRASWAEPRAEAVFRTVLDRVRPDIVHFQHLIHTSVGLVDVAKERGLATVAHLHDYWPLCARVQMVRPDGALCPEGMGAGCFLCVRERALSQVPRLARLGRERPELCAKLAAGGHPRRGAAGPRWEGLAELLRRHDEVTGAYAACDLRVSPSRFLRALMIEKAGFDAHTTLYSDNGLVSAGLRALPKQPDPRGRLRLGFVGTLAWYKGAEVAVRALGLLRGTPCTLSVWGDFRPEEDRGHGALLELARELGAEVEFRGRFDNRRLSEVHAEIDALVVPSVWYENSPVTIHEAWATRTPVVASRLGGMAEYVRHEVDGLLFEPGDPAALAQAIERLANEPGLLQRLARAAPVPKTIEEDAADTETRYRQLACIDRRPRPRVLLERSARETVRRGGAAEEQGADLLLLRPGAFAEYDVGPAVGRDRLLEIRVLALGGEREVPLGGRVLQGGRELGCIAPRPAGDEDELRRETLRATLQEGEPLRLEPSVGGQQVFLRLARVVVREPDPESASLRRDATASSSHA